LSVFAIVFKNRP